MFSMIPFIKPCGELLRLKKMDNDSSSKPEYFHKLKEKMSYLQKDITENNYKQQTLKLFDQSFP